MLLFSTITARFKCSQRLSGKVNTFFLQNRHNPVIYRFCGVDIRTFSDTGSLDFTGGTADQENIAPFQLRRRQKALLLPERA